MEPNNPQPVNPESLQYQSQEDQPSQQPSDPIKKKLMYAAIGVGAAMIIIVSVLSLLQFNQQLGQSGQPETSSQQPAKLSDGRVRSNTVPPISYYEENVKTGLTGDEFSQANNVKRTSDVTQILNAILMFEQSTGGIPPQIPMSPQEISTNGIDLCTALVGQNYTPALPMDPWKQNPKENVHSGIENCSVSYETGYTVMKDADGKVTVSAPLAEKGETISKTQ